MRRVLTQLAPVHLPTFLVMCAVVFSLGCGIETTARLEISGEEPPIRLFDQIEIDIGSEECFESRRGMGPFHLSAQVRLISRLKDTADLRMIPVISIDSICLRGNCLDSTRCSNSMSIVTKSIDSSDILEVTDSMYQAPDGYFFKGEFRPRSFNFGSSVYFRVNCYEDVNITFYASKHDRLTMSLIAQEAKVVKYRLKKKRHLTAGY